MKFHFLGDSHVRAFYQTTLPGQATSISGASIHGLANQNSKTGANNTIKNIIKGVSENTVFLIMLGNVDLDFTLWYKKARDPDLDEYRYVDSIVTVYKEYLATLPKKRIVIMSPHLPTVGDDHFFEKQKKYANEKLQTAASEYGEKITRYTNLVERTKLCIYMGQRLRECLDHPVIDITEQLLAPDSQTIKNEYTTTPYDHHPDFGKIVHLWQETVIQTIK